MADRQELKKIEAQLQEIAKLYTRLGKTNPFAGKDAKQITTELRGARTAAFALETNIKGLNAELVDASSGLKDITKDINQYLAEIGIKGPTAFQSYKKNLKGIRSIASRLEDLQDDLGEATEKQLIGLQKRNQLEIIRAEKNINAIFEEKQANLENEQDRKAFSEAKEKYLKVEADYSKKIIAGEALQAEYDKNELAYKKAIEKGNEKEKDRLFKKGNELLKQLDTQEKITIQKGAERDNVLGILQNLGNVTDDELAALATVEERKKAQEDLNKALEENLRRVKNINKAQGLTGKIVKGLGGSLEKLGFGDLGLSQIQDDMKELAMDITENGDKAAGFGGKFRIMLKGLSEITKNLAKNLMDPVVIIGLLVKGFKSLLEFGQKVAGEIATVGQQFMGLGSEAERLDQSFRNMAANDPFLSVKEAREAFISLNKEFGTAVEFSERESKVFKQLSYDLGLGAEQTSKLYKLSQLSGSSFESITAEINGTVEQLNLANGLSLNQTEILEDITKLSATVRTNLGNNPKTLANAVYQARRLGMSLDEINSAAGSTLDFESSIEKQLSTQLILGTQLDASAYRRAALAGDSETAAKELNRLIAENSDRLEGNVIAQQEFASFLGISQEQLLAGMETSKLQEKLALKGITDRANAEEALNKIMKDNPRLSQAEALAKLSQKDIDNIIEAKETSEGLSRAYEQIKETFTSKFAPIAEDLAKQLVTFMKGDGFEGIKSTVEALAEGAASIVKLAMPVIKFVAENPLKALKIVIGGFLTALLAGLAIQKLIPQVTIPVGGYGKLLKV